MVVTLDISAETAQELFETVYQNSKRDGQPFGQALMEVLKKKLEPPLSSDATSLRVKLKDDLQLEIHLRVGTQEPEKIRLYAELEDWDKQSVSHYRSGYELSVKSGRPTKSIKADSPKADSPKADSPKADSPKADSPKEDSPKADSPKEDSPKEDFRIVENYDKPFFYWLNRKWDEHCKDKLLETCDSLKKCKKDNKERAPIDQKKGQIWSNLELQEKQQRKWKEHEREKNQMISWLPTMKEIQEANGSALAGMIERISKNAGELGFYYLLGESGEPVDYCVIPTRLMQKTVQTNGKGEKKEIWKAEKPTEALNITSCHGIPMIIPSNTSLVKVDFGWGAEKINDLCRKFLRNAIYDCKRRCDDTASSRQNHEENRVSDILEKANTRNKFLQSLAELLRQGGTPWWDCEINETWLAEHWKELDLRIVTINDKDGKSTQYIVKCEDTCVPGPGSHPTGGEVEICSGAILIPLELGADPIMATESMKGMIDRGTSEDKTKIWNQLINEVMPGALPGSCTSYDVLNGEYLTALKECHPNYIKNNYDKLMSDLALNGSSAKTVEGFLHLLRSNPAQCTKLVLKDKLFKEPANRYSFVPNPFFECLICLQKVTEQLTEQEKAECQGLTDYINQLAKGPLLDLYRKMKQYFNKKRSPYPLADPDKLSPYPLADPDKLSPYPLADPDKLSLGELAQKCSQLDNSLRYVEHAVLYLLAATDSIPESNIVRKNMCNILLSDTFPQDGMKLPDFLEKLTNKVEQLRIATEDDIQVLRKNLQGIRTVPDLLKTNETEKLWQAIYKFATAFNGHLANWAGQFKTRAAKQAVAPPTVKPTVTPTTVKLTGTQM